MAFDTHPGVPSGFFPEILTYTLEEWFGYLKACQRHFKSVSIYDDLLQDYVGHYYPGLPPLEYNQKPYQYTSKYIRTFGETVEGQELSEKSKEMIRSIYLGQYNVLGQFFDGLLRLCFRTYGNYDDNDGQVTVNGVKMNVLKGIVVEEKTRFGNRVIGIRDDTSQFRRYEFHLLIELLKRYGILFVVPKPIYFAVILRMYLDYKQNSASGDSDNLHFLKINGVTAQDIEEADNYFASVQQKKKFAFKQVVSPVRSPRASPMKDF
jgi:hypothetical protein